MVLKKSTWSDSFLNSFYKINVDEPIKTVVIMILVGLLVLFAKLLFKTSKQLIDYIYAKYKFMNENKLCYLCKFEFPETKPREAIHQLRDKEFGDEFQPTCDYHYEFELGLVWEEKKKRRNYRKEMMKKTEEEIGKSLLIGAERTTLSEEISMWERIKEKSLGLSKNIVNCYIRKLYKEKEQLEFYY